MAEKYLYGSLIAAFVWTIVSLIFYEASGSMLLLLGPGILFVILCYIIGLLKDIRAKLGIREIGSEEKFFYEAEKEESNGTSVPETESPKEDTGK